MYFVNIRVTHKTGPQEIIIFMNLRESEKRDFCENLKSQSSINEVVLLQTCNRFEIYFSGSGVQQGIAQAQKVMLERFGEKIRKHMIVDRYTDALKHLFDTVSSLNSLIIGENQILAQVKEAYEFAAHYQFTNMVLNLVFQKALFIGKKVRCETEISKGKVSISSAAVDLANQYKPLKNKKIILIGTGKMASLLAQYLNKFRPLELIIIGRTPSRIRKFCETYSCTSIPFCNISKELRTTDVLFSATSCPSVLITKEMIQKLMKERKQSIILIDIAVPSDIDPAVKDISLVNHFSITDLRDLSYQNMVLRKEEIVKVRAILKNELVEFNRKLQDIHKHQLVSQLMKYTETIRQEETSKAIKIMDNSKKTHHEIMEAFSKSLVEKIMHNFITRVNSAEDYSSMFNNLVDLFVGNNYVSKDSYETIEK